MNQPWPAFRLVFRSLADAQADCSFPCDAHGAVYLDLLDDDTRNQYFFARAMVGRATRGPEVVQANATSAMKKGILQ